jgi:hypothetical protein
MFFPDFQPWLLHSLAIAGQSLAPAPAPAATVTVQNLLAEARPLETVSLPLAQLPAAVRALAPQKLRVRDAATQAVLLSQTVDTDGDRKPDELLFQVALPAKGRKNYTVDGSGADLPPSPNTTFARFVPERTDDFAWENDRVAFRTYGPNAEQLYDKKDPNGTLSSGMDNWLKRVPYPIIDRWYGRHQYETPFAYHTDQGEGHDPYHVGSSRGTGGTGVLDGGKLYTARNFTSYKILALGPIRTVFELTYAPYDAAGRQVTEKKVISLDLGSNLTRHEEHITADKPLPNCTIGVTLHEAKGEVKADQPAGWCRYWEKSGDSFLGTGVVVAPGYLTDYQDHRSAEKDASQLYLVTRPKQDVVVFYAGFGWTKSGQFAAAADWDAYLAAFARRLASPLQVSWK